jgi:hypothetical protein
MTNTPHFNLCTYCQHDAVDTIRDEHGRPTERHCARHAAEYREWQQHIAAGGIGPTPLSGIVWPPHAPVVHQHPIDRRLRAWGTPKVCDCCLRTANVLRDGVQLCEVHEALDDDAIEALRRPAAI